MALPGTHNRVQLFMSYFDQTGNGLSGTVTFQPDVGNVDTGDLFFLRDTPVTVTLENGTANLSLLATDDNTLSATDWVYKVTENVDGETSHYRIRLPFTAGAVQNLATTAQIPWDGK